MSFATYADLVAAKRLHYSVSLTSVGSAATSAWILQGTPLPTTATTPGTAYVSASSIAPLQDLDPIEKYLAAFEMHCATISNAQSGWLFDRLVGVSQSIATTGDKTINSTALTRYTTGEDVQVFLEVSTTASGGGPVISLSSYTNSDGTSGRSGATATFPAISNPVGTWVGPMPLQAGDIGVKSVETINVSSTGGAGVVNVVLVRPLLFLGQGVGSTNIIPAFYQEFMFPPRIYDGASLAMIWSGATSIPSVQIGLTLALSV